MEKEKDGDRRCSRWGARRVGIWLFCGLIVLAGVITLVYSFFARGFVERKLLEQLNETGAKWSLDVRSVTWSGVDLADISAGTDGRFRIDCARFDYDLSELRKQHLRRVSLIGATWEVVWTRDVGLDLGLPPLPPSHGGARIDLIDVRSSTLALRIDGQLWHVSVEGSVARDDDGLTVDAMLGLPGLTLRVQGLLPLPETDGLARLDLRVADVGDALVDVAGTIAGELLARLEADLVDGTPAAVRVDVGAHLGPLDRVLAGRRVAFRDAQLSAQGAFDADWTPLALEVSVSTEAAALDGRRLREAGLRLELGNDEPETTGRYALVANGGGTLEPSELFGVVPFQVAGELVVEPKGKASVLEIPSIRIELPSIALEQVHAIEGLGAQGTVGLLARGQGRADREGAELDVVLELSAPWAELWAPDPQHALCGTEITLLGPLSMITRDGAVTLGLAGDGRIRVGSVRRGDEGEGIEFGQLELSLVGEAGLTLPLVQDEQVRATGTWTVELASPVHVESPSVSARIERFGVTGMHGVTEGEPTWFPALSLDLALEHCTLKHPQVELEGLALRAPLPFGLPPANTESSAGSFELEHVAYDGLRLDGPRGSLQRDADGVALTGSWRPLPGSTGGVDLELRGRIDDHSMVLEATTPESGAAIRRGDPFGTWLAERFELELETELAFAAMARVDANGPRCELRLTTEHGVLEAAGKHRFEQVALSLELVDAFTLRSAEPAQLSFESGRTGRLALGPGDVLFAFDGPSSFHLLSARCETAKGSKFWAQGFHIDATRPATEVLLLCHELDLEEWLELSTSGRATGEGQLNGHLVLEVDLENDPRFRLAGGRLASTGTGTLQFEDTEVVRELLMSTMGSYTLAEGVDLSQLLRDRVIGALEDFSYEALLFELVREEGGLTLQARTHGRGTQVPQELDLTANFRGFGELLEILLDLDLNGEE